MPIVDRLEYPKKYKLKDTVLLLVIVAAILGIWFGSCSNRAQKKRVIIHSVKFEDYGRQYIRLGYDIENKGKNTEEIRLLARVFDSEGGEITSIFFITEIDANTREYQTKFIDQMYRPLVDGEKPYRATLQIMQRTLFGND